MPTDAPLRVGIIGAGMIATGAMGVLPGLPSSRERIDVVSVASRTRSTAQAASERFGIPRVETVEQMLSADDIDAVVNLTPISAHFEINRDALRAGKHLATEKPLAGSLAEADELVRLARDNGLHVVASPPRLVEPSRVRAKSLIDSGAIGKVTFARARASHAGPAALGWPTDPAPAYAAGASPFRDLSPYAIQQLTGLLGSALTVSALSGRTSPTKLVEGGPYDGTTIEVGTDDNTVLLIDFGDAVFGVIDAGFSVRAASSPAVEIFGSAGTIALHTEYPPRAEGSLDLFTADRGWRGESPPEDRAEESRRWDLGRAVLVEELAAAVHTGTPSILSAEQARHTLAVIVAAEEAAASGTTVRVDAPSDA